MILSRRRGSSVLFGSSLNRAFTTMRSYHGSSSMPGIEGQGQRRTTRWSERDMDKLPLVTRPRRVAQRER